MRQRLPFSSLWLLGEDVMPGAVAANLRDQGKVKGMRNVGPDIFGH